MKNCQWELQHQLMEQQVSVNFSVVPPQKPSIRQTITDDLVCSNQWRTDEKTVKEIKKPFHLDKHRHPLSWHSGKTDEVFVFGLCLGDQNTLFFGKTNRPHSYWAAYMALAKTLVMLPRAFSAGDGSPTSLILWLTLTSLVLCVFVVVVDGFFSSPLYPAFCCIFVMLPFP